MSYLLVAILFLLLAAGFITFLVLRATKRATPATAGEEASGDREDDAPPFAADPSGGTGRPTGGVDSVEEKPPLEPHPEGRFQRDPVGGEAEARPYTERG